MKIVNPEPVLECSLDEFWVGFWSKFEAGYTQKGEVVKTFCGESKIKPRFRIPSADKQSDVFFDNREMLCRFANFPTPTQESLLRSIRNALNENKVRRMVISIPWSKNGFRKLLVRSTSINASVLDFEMLPS